MARKTRGTAARRPPQPRRPPAAAERDAGEDLEQRLAALEREREELLERARSAGVLDDAPAAEEQAGDAGDGAAEDADGDAGADGTGDGEAGGAGTAPVTRRRVGTTTVQPASPARRRPVTATTATTEAAARPSSARRVGRVAGETAAARPRAATGRSNIPGPTATDSLDPADAAIPLERVPYVGADLRRVGVIAGLMVVLIVIADIVVRVVVK